jgi:membrane-bound lytic murein transglycosylase
MKKQCSKCNKKYNIENFHKQKASADGRSSYCKNCHRKYCLEWKLKNKKKIKKQQKEYKIKNREILNQYNKQWIQENPDKILAIRKKYRIKYKDKINKQRRKKRRENINFKLRTIISNRIRMALIRGSKNSTAYELTGCSWDHLKIFFRKTICRWNDLGKLWQMAYRSYQTML